MGCLYTGSGIFTLNPENTLATFEGGTVYYPEGTMFTGNETLMYYDGGRIYRYLDETLVSSPVVLAWCGKFASIKTKDGTLLGYCENGKVMEKKKRSAYRKEKMIRVPLLCFMKINHFQERTLITFVPPTRSWNMR